MLHPYEPEIDDAWYSLPEARQWARTYLASTPSPTFGSQQHALLHNAIASGIQRIQDLCIESFWTPSERLAREVDELKVSVMKNRAILAPWRRLPDRLWGDVFDFLDDVNGPNSAAPPTVQGAGWARGGAHLPLGEFGYGTPEERRRYQAHLRHRNSPLLLVNDERERPCLSSHYRVKGHTVSQVSSYWRAAAFNEKRCWSSIYIDGHNIHLALFNLWLQRSGGAWLHIHTKGEVPNSYITPLLAQIHRWRSFTVDSPGNSSNGERDWPVKTGDSIHRMMVYSHRAVNLLDVRFIGNAVYSWEYYNFPPRTRVYRPVQYFNHLPRLGDLPYRSVVVEHQHGVDGPPQHYINHMQNQEDQDPWLVILHLQMHQQQHQNGVAHPEGGGIIVENHANPHPDGGGQYIIGHGTFHRDPATGMDIPVDVEQLDNRLHHLDGASVSPTPIMERFDLSRAVAGDLSSTRITAQRPVEQRLLTELIMPNRCGGTTLDWLLKEFTKNAPQLTSLVFDDNWRDVDMPYIPTLRSLRLYRGFRGYADRNGSGSNTSRAAAIQFHIQISTWLDSLPNLAFLFIGAVYWVQVRAAEQVLTYLHTLPAEDEFAYAKMDGGTMMAWDDPWFLCLIKRGVFLPETSVPHPTREIGFLRKVGSYEMPCKVDLCWSEMMRKVDASYQYVNNHWD